MEIIYEQRDDVFRMSQETQHQVFNAFKEIIRKLYGAELLNRAPHVTELIAIEDKYAQKGFPACLGAIDCMHLRWKKFPRAFKGQY